MLVVVAAGPLFTLFLTILSITLLKSGTVQHNLQAWAMLAELNVVLFLLGLVPNGSKAVVRNDSALLHLLLRDTPDTHDVLLFHILLQMQREGYRPRQYPEDVIREIALRSPRPEIGCYFARAVSDWAMDRNDLATADAWDRRALDLSLLAAPQHANTALAHAACLDILLREDLSAAASKCQEIDFRALQPVFFRYRTQAVRQLTAKRVLEAVAELQHAESALTSARPLFDFERGLCKRLRQIGVAISKAESLPETL